MPHKLALALGIGVAAYFALRTGRAQASEAKATSAPLDPTRAFNRGTLYTDPNVRVLKERAERERPIGRKLIQPWNGEGLTNTEVKLFAGDSRLTIGAVPLEGTPASIFQPKFRIDDVTQDPRRGFWPRV